MVLVPLLSYEVDAGAPSYGHRARREVLALPPSPGPACIRWAHDLRAEVREFLSSRRAAAGGRPAFGGDRRMKGSRCEEVAMLAGVSNDYCLRMERGNLPGASDSVLGALARALDLGHRRDLRPVRQRGAPRQGRRAWAPATSTCTTSTGWARERRATRRRYYRCCASWASAWPPAPRPATAS
nr:helix-turn-helix domain-containing protein [Nonomuraea sp. PA05]